MKSVIATRILECSRIPDSAFHLVLVECRDDKPYAVGKVDPTQLRHANQGHEFYVSIRDGWDCDKLARISFESWSDILGAV